MSGAATPTPFSATTCIPMIETTRAQQRCNVSTTQSTEVIASRWTTYTETFCAVGVMPTPNLSVPERSWTTRCEV